MRDRFMRIPDERSGYKCAVRYFSYSKVHVPGVVFLLKLKSTRRYTTQGLSQVSASPLLVRPHQSSQPGGCDE